MKPFSKGVLQSGDGEHHLFCLGNGDMHSVWRAYPQFVQAEESSVIIYSVFLYMEIVRSSGLSFYVSYRYKYIFMRPSSQNLDLPRISQVVLVCIWPSPCICLPALKFILTVHMLNFNFHLRPWRVYFWSLVPHMGTSSSQPIRSQKHLFEKLVLQHFELHESPLSRIEQRVFNRVSGAVWWVTSIMKPSQRIQMKS